MEHILSPDCIYMFNTYAYGKFWIVLSTLLLGFTDYFGSWKEIGRYILRLVGTNDSD
jgi:hypothetical protein